MAPRSGVVKVAGGLQPPGQPTATTLASRRLEFGHFPQCCAPNVTVIALPYPRRRRHNSSAQGNALGTRPNLSIPALKGPNSQCLEPHNRATRILVRECDIGVLPFQDWRCLGDRIPRTLPWAAESKPFGLDECPNSSEPLRGSNRQAIHHQKSDTLDPIILPPLSLCGLRPAYGSAPRSDPSRLPPV